MAGAMLAAFIGCRKPAAPADTGQDPHLKPYFVRGTVVSVTAPGKTPPEVVLKHEAIAGLMGPMTMEYPVEEAVRGELHPGDRITATLQVEKTDGPLKIAGLTDFVVIAQARPDYVPAMQYHVPAPGDTVPDFVLRNQSGKFIHLDSFKGKVLLMTFIYTRCPLADYCPKMSRNFAEIDKALAANPKLYAGTHLLTASFDPDYDTPAVLRSYGGAYTGNYSKESFDHWDFAVPSAAELPRVEQWFDLGVTPGENGTLQHSLATLVIGKDGKVAAFYPTKDWTVDQLLAEVGKAAAA